MPHFICEEIITDPPKKVTWLGEGVAPREGFPLGRVFWAKDFLDTEIGNTGVLGSKFIKEVQTDMCTKINSCV